ncbi:50S ribosomal protein L29 [Candidatus Acetothermia bacterium]|nr:50S ribosomal protein L29 [Candidatus Acetothermia bacterium]MBI3642875.1 50S ribosomal protein L29 [Candidatus Acetothermia bacterium]
MTGAELRDLTVEELHQKLAEIKRKLFNVRFQVTIGQQDNTASMKMAKRDIARIKTVLRERELGLTTISAGES